jgi:hypothetical protein
MLQQIHAANGAADAAAVLHVLSRCGPHEDREHAQLSKQVPHPRGAGSFIETHKAQALHCTALHCTAQGSLHCIALHYTAAH